MLRRRNNQVLLRLTDKEYQFFKKQVGLSGLKMNQYMIKLIFEKEIKPRPPKEYSQMVYEMAKIGNNINQIAYKANLANYVTKDMADTAVLLMERCYDIVKDLE